VTEPLDLLGHLCPLPLDLVALLQDPGVMALYELISGQDLRSVDLQDVQEAIGDDPPDLSLVRGGDRLHPAELGPGIIGAEGADPHSPEIPRIHGVPDQLDQILPTGETDLPGELDPMGRLDPRLPSEIDPQFERDRIPLIVPLLVDLEVERTPLTLDRDLLLEYLLSTVHLDSRLRASERPGNSLQDCRDLLDNPLR
jgi:hypothetical protein